MRPHRTDASASSGRFQSTHPRGVRHAARLVGKAIGEVSIHAPAWGATADCAGAGNFGQVSIHAPAWGATGGGDGKLDGSWFVSIHAPAWGATRQKSACRWIPSLFQSTHPRGVRRRPVPGYHGREDVSIHAPAWGATRRATCCPPSWTSFNPRTRVGCDNDPSDQLETEAEFQSTHPRGVRRTI